MLWVRFSIGSQEYALDSTHVVEVAPLVELRPVPMAPPLLAGLFRYRGQLLPALDLPALHTSTPASPLLSTRVIVVDAGSSGSPHLIGLVAERVTDTYKTGPAADMPSPVRLPNAPHLTGYLLEGAEPIQVVDPVALLTPEVREMIAVTGDADVAG